MKLKVIKTIEEGLELHKKGELVGRFDMPNWLYHKLPGVSSTSVRKVLQSKNKFKWAKENSMEQTPAMVFGSLLHMMVLQPDRFKTEFLIAPDVAKRSKEEKAIWADAEAMAEKDHLTLVKQEVVEEVEKLAEKTMELAKGYFKKTGFYEESIFWIIPVGGQNILCKIRPDYYDEEYCIDLKSCSDAGEGFIQSVEKFRYDIQAHWYTIGMNSLKKSETFYTHEHFLFLAQEKTEDCDNRMWRLSAESYNKSDAKVNQALKLFSEIENYGVYGRYSRDIGTLTTRPWVD